MANIMLEIEPRDDQEEDQAWEMVQALGPFLARVLGMSISVSDGYGNTKDFDPTNL
ncbi:hypothetical protein SEA_WOFFORD_264 [Streptomyces phage Wofford]|uniref:Uncharacterized protein n=1 Tax=Streptomyces phage Wofford TaxID=2283267 RepID=A0A345MA77_9CAUD|nr:hypothetical protein HWB78_gp006 [Streptomyces phage Wollford]YP_009839907.1 hypothetical protein HWB78_gp055 [Streptomyces phage Wollford]AXH67204.1 hypothetical protein SEA_WOFFORD_6 [Streptomyces phage Wollford]AXH67398.1 hypothetical protein SEA_WOFFORD_264 [Streptomyces phage Wollford]